MPIGIDGDAGRIVGIYVEAGDHVKKGQLLAKLDDSVLIPQVNRLAASLEQTRAQAALSAAEYRRAQAVAPAGALSAEDVEKRRATQITDEATVKVAAAQLAEYEARLNRTHVVAPVDGTVLMRKAEVGQIANSGGDALFASPAAAKLKCGVRSQSRTWRLSRSARRPRSISPACRGRLQDTCACWAPSSIQTHDWVRSASR